MEALMGRLPAYQKYPDELAQIAGTRFSDLEDPLHQAMWLRLYDEAHNPRAYRVMSPIGEFGDFVRNATGKNAGQPSKIAWGSFDEIGKAIQAMQSGGDSNAISRILSPAHKVRNFNNNMATPNETRFGDVTADTHQVAGNQFRPLSGNTEAVAHNFGSGLDKKFQTEGYRSAPNSSVTGVMGTYGLNAEPARRLAAELGVLPRAGQSLTWEGIRALFTDTFKTPENMSRVNDLMGAVDRKEITLDDARRRIVDLAGGFKTPDWAQPRSLLAGPPASSTYR
jgi:hypothetical protein